MAPSGPDLSEFFRHSQPKKPPCQVAHAKEQLDKDANEQLDAAFAEAKGLITPGAIAKWLEARGYNISVQRVLAHRKKQCTCYAE